MKDLRTIELDIPAVCDRIALCGGPYSNFGAVAAFLDRTAGVDYRFCLGDMGGFGPFPNRTLELLRQAAVICVQGNYDQAIGDGDRDCGCGYTDPRDREFAQISYDYTYAHTAPTHRQWLQTLPQLIRLRWRDRAFLLCHGSPDVVNEFVWESDTADSWIASWLDRFAVDGIFATHTGIPWVRQVAQGFWCNVGVLGRPAHEGQPHVYFAELRWPRAAAIARPEIVPLSYDPQPVVAAMAREGLPTEFQQSLLTGIWTTCAEILPEAERRVRSRLPVPQRS
ncbi:metallophosphoesterase family protein [Leptolyngbya iicbica]|uniref:metallophosphoesterase family protein n=1 Tax=Leptolyngbya iicbica TaxID=3161580 RepID=UPI000A7EB484|nr:metallophosphoesterase [Leptolyngbya sp. LK]